MNEVLRWAVAGLVLVLVVGLVAVARGDDHHRGDDVGSLVRPTLVSG